MTVARPVRQAVTDWDEYAGTLAAPETVNVMARVSGFVESVPFGEGALVQKGDLLYVIDPRPLRATLDARSADAGRAAAQAKLASDQLSRYTMLRQQGTISPQDYENVESASAQADAALKGANAAVESARLDLEWTQVVAPISGRVGRQLVTRGNLVNGGAGAATMLTTIESIDPIYCYFDVNERAVLKYQQLIREGRLASARAGRLPVFLALANETDFPHGGVINFVNNRMDPGTGTVSVRGVFANHDRRMLPGFSATARLPASGVYETSLIPAAAVGTDQNLRYLLVLKPDDTVDRRNVTLGGSFGLLRAITEGITDQDRVVIEGLLHARPGAKVSPQEGRIAPATVQLLPTTLPSTEPSEPDTGPAVQSASFPPTTGPSVTITPATSSSPPPVSSLPATRPSGAREGGSGR